MDQLKLKFDPKGRAYFEPYRHKNRWRAAAICLTALLIAQITFVSRAETPAPRPVAVVKQDIGPQWADVGSMTDQQIKSEMLELTKLEKNADRVKELETELMHRMEAKQKAKLVGYIRSTYLIAEEAATRIVDAAFEASSKWGGSHTIRPEMVIAVAAVESGFNPYRISPKNAKGLMQVIEKWHPEIVEGRDLTDVQVGVEAGVRVLHKYLVKNNGELALAFSDYNNDPGRGYYTKVMAELSKIKAYRAT